MHTMTDLHPRSTRRWPRYQIDLPVRVIAINGILTTPIMGRGSDISRAGMALNAKIPLNPGDLMQLQFPTTEPSRVNAIVRHRNGTRLGLEFLGQLPPDEETKIQLKSLPGATPPVTVTYRKSAMLSCTPKNLSDALRRKQEELRQLQKEIEVLKIAILLLAEDDKEACLLPVPRLQASKAWPIQA
jgi:hypothetical protein